MFLGKKDSEVSIDMYSNVNFIYHCLHVQSICLSLYWLTIEMDSPIERFKVNQNISYIAHTSPFSVFPNGKL